MNLAFSIMLILSGVYSFFCFVPATGKRLFPNLYAEGASIAQRYGILLTGLFSVAVGLYSIFIKPLFLLSA